MGGGSSKEVNRQSVENYVNNVFVNNVHTEVDVEFVNEVVNEAISNYIFDFSTNCNSGSISEQNVTWGELILKDCPFEMSQISNNDITSHCISSNIQDLQVWNDMQTSVENSVKLTSEVLSDNMIDTIMEGALANDGLMDGLKDFTGIFENFSNLGGDLLGKDTSVENILEMTNKTRNDIRNDISTQLATKIVNKTKNSTITNMNMGDTVNSLITNFTGQDLFFPKVTCTGGSINVHQLAKTKLLNEVFHTSDTSTSLVNSFGTTFTNQADVDAATALKNQAKVEAALELSYGPLTNLLKGIQDIANMVEIVCILGVLACCCFLCISISAVVGIVVYRNRHFILPKGGG